MREAVNIPNPVQLDTAAPRGTFAIDEFSSRFRVPDEEEKAFEAELAAEDGEQELPGPFKDELRRSFKNVGLKLFRVDANRLVRLALLRTERDDTTLPKARLNAGEFMDLLETVRTGLDDLIAFGPAHAAAADMRSAFQQRENLPYDNVHGAAAHIIKIMEAAGDLRDWAKHFTDAFELTRRRERNFKPLPRHVATLAVDLYEKRLGKRPPASRQHWLAEFLAALWADFKLPALDDDVGYLGGKIEEALKVRRSQG
jgi:hypothetical protein